MKSGIVEPSRPSRWDALRSDDSQSSRRRPLNAPQNHHNGSISSFSSSNISSISWRKRSQANNDFKNRLTPRSVEEDTITTAIDNLRAAINSETNDSNSNAESITELNNALFGTADAVSTEDLLLSNEVNTSVPLAKASNDVKWEATYSLLQILSLPTIHKSIHNQYILCITRSASACLHLLSSQYDGVCPRSMSDLRLCECVMILLNVLQDENVSETNGYNELLHKSYLFQCIAKLLLVSTIHGRNPKNTREGRGPLCSWGAEKTLTLIIRNSVLPFLEDLMCNNDEALTVANESICFHGAIECIYILLLGANDDVSRSVIMTERKAFQASKHAAAMLAALVVDVTPDGKETQRVNPLRPRLLRAINDCWRCSCEGIQRSIKTEKIPTFGLEMALRCMTVTLDTMHALDKTTQSTRGNSEMNVSVIARNIKALLETETLTNFRPQILRLLTSLCLAYPVSTANQWHLFLDKTGSTHPFLLTTIEEGTMALRCQDFDNASWVLLPHAVQTVSSLISSIPFTNWIGDNGRASTRMSGGNFACRVRKTMLMLMATLTNLITAVKAHITEGDSCPDEALFEFLMMESASVASKLCFLLPFNGCNEAFLAPAVTLVQSAGDIFVLSSRALESKGRNHALLMSSMAQFSHVFTTINDGEASISAPLEHWLSDASSFDFIGMLLNDSYSAPTLSSSSKCKLEVLTSIAKSAPWSITREPFNLASFREICANLCNVQNDTSHRLLGVKLIEAFVVGRKVYVMKYESETVQHKMELPVVPDSFCPLLHSALSDQSSAVRTCAVTSYGSLLVTDWVVLLSPGSSNEDTSSLDWSHVDSILGRCTCTGEKSGNVRSAACKAVGDICTVCVGSLLSEEMLERRVPFSDDFVVAISAKVCNTMVQALKDKTASVRSMALFAIGNTSLALKDRCAFLSMHHMLPLVNACIADKDDKVVGNAIRTIGHVSYFIYTPEFLSNADGNVSDDLKLYCSLLLNLTAKIHDVLSDASGETSRELTWKQRNNAKKHAWGAATTIGMLLSQSHLLSHFDDSIVEAALLQLFRCIQLHAFINEKIFAASVNALATLPASLWKYISAKKSKVIAYGLATFLNFLELPQRKVDIVYQTNVESLANALVLIASKTDFCQLFLLRDTLPFSIDFFYQWLISRSVPYSTLEEVVAAVSCKEVELVMDVSDIQIFLSRTVQRNQVVQQNTSLQSISSDDEDEL